jgi:hypothetical protein
VIRYKISDFRLKDTLFKTKKVFLVLVEVKFIEENYDEAILVLDNFREFISEPIEIKLSDLNENEKLNDSCLIKKTPRA